MGAALLDGWLGAKLPAAFSVIEPHDIVQDKIPHYRTVPDAIEDLKKAEIVILAVKPQTMNEVCTQLKTLIGPKTLILSIAAGRTLAGFASFFGAAQPLIRSMPNTPAAIGKGMTVAIANKHVSPAQKTLAADLLKCAGAFEWIEDETLLDAITALSGSGPAYVFYLIEMLAASGKKLGLSADLAMTLARQTVIGSAALAESEPKISADTLRHNVTSPAGTTEAALKVLMDGRAQAIFDDALAAAKKRGKELNN